MLHWPHGQGLRCTAPIPAGLGPALHATRVWCWSWMHTACGSCSNQFKTCTLGDTYPGPAWAGAICSMHPRVAGASSTCSMGLSLDRAHAMCVSPGTWSRGGKKGSVGHLRSVDWPCVTCSAQRSLTAVVYGIATLHYKGGYRQPKSFSQQVH